jgi:hypothetical protein
MTEKPPAPEEWRRLHEAAMRVKELAPWEWMAEDDLFGVQDPETDELGFVSVMGALGEHYSVAVYLGPQALYDFLAIEEAGSAAPAESILEVPQLQASFEDRNILRDEDRQIIKQLGLKFRGRNAWPMFRSYRPGYFPWYLEADEARFLAVALEQVLDVTPRFREDPALLEPGDEQYLVRVSRRKRKGVTWEDRVMDVPPPERPSIRLMMDVPLLEKLKQSPQRGSRIEMDFFMFPVPFQEEKGARPQFSYMLLTVEAQSGFVLGTDLLKPEPTLESVWGQVPLYAVRHFASLGIVPQEVVVRSGLLFRLLESLVEELHFDLKLSRRLRMLDNAKDFLLNRFM